MKKYQICNNPRCGYAYNSPSSKNCELCEEKLNPSINKLKIGQSKKPIGKLNKNQQNIIAAIFCLIVLGLGLFNLKRPLNTQLIATKELPSGILRYWGPPCSERLMSQKIIQAINKNNDKFKILLVDVDRNQDAVAELINKQISIVLHEKSHFPHHQDKANSKGIKLQGIPYALDGIAYIVNKNINGIEHLTIEDLEKIYRGEITNWREVGGEDRKITPILLSGLGRNSLFLNFKGKLNPNMIYVKDRNKAISVLKLNEGAIFYTSATLAALEKDINIIPLKNQNGEVISPVVDGQPNKKAFKEGIYPQIRTLFAIIRQGEKSIEREMVNAFVEYLTSSEGQAMVKKAGFVPLYLPI